jgi:hypothetical protein
VKFKPSTFWLLLIATIAYVFFFIVKCLHFQRSDYNGDIFSHFQLSRDWLLGKPLFYENSFGFHNRIHNYFIDILMSPFTYFFNVYGLFIVLFGLMIGALYGVLRILEKQGASFQTKLLFLIFYTGPLTYFLLHDEHYGFHAEMLLMPLGLLFTTSFLQKNKWQLLWGLLMILVKEDGVVVLWSCIAVCLLITWHKKEIPFNILLRKMLLSTALCSLIFIAGLLWLKYQNNGGETRMGWVLQSLTEQRNDELTASFLYLFKLRIQLTVPVLIIIFLYSGWKFTVGAMIIAIPILLLNFMAGSLYFDNGEFMIKNYFSLLWCPRLSMYWAYWLSVLLAALTQKPAVIIYPKFLRTVACFIFGVLVFKFQLYFFINCYVTRFDIVENIKEAFQPNIEFELKPEFKDAAAIARQLPAHYPVAPMYRVFGAFYRQDIVWLNALQNAYFPPRMIIASYNKDEIPDVTKVLKHPLFLHYKERLYIYTEAEDTIYVSRAGIKGAWVRMKNEESIQGKL